ncbi:MAG TPA: hypothetical protein VK081_04715 [Planctomycetota bacterium]|nr:hypothetical protein [Planctomycetota bacterium]
MDPDPAPEGGRITVTVDGPGPYFVRTGGSSSDWQPLPIDPETGKATIDVVGSPPQTIDISNRDEGSPDQISVPIQASD